MTAGTQAERERLPAPGRGWAGRPLPLLLAGLTLAAGVSAPRADRVVFTDHRMLQVESVEARGEWLDLHLGGDNRIRVARSRVLRIVRDRVEPPRTENEPGKADWREQAGPFADFFQQAAERHRLEAALLLAVATVESGLDPLALSPKGAMGLMQLMPATADELAVEDPYDPEQNIDAGAAWLRRMLERFGGDLDLALAAYNAGEGAVRRFGGVPPYQETKNFVRRVRERVRRLSAGGSGA
ncbi:MAG: lytic transglycosylase domain-containing protein [Acidobacteriota bacterium]|nr:lytic transglycosylase domain-containing protein [Acidobacteriota bacterium]MDQ7086758.1 lytic transglycosylase domain-containing protein [Acidobacteriota bacterium]